MNPIVVIGSGLAGYSVAKELRKLDREAPLAVVTEDEGALYSKPMLSNAFALKKAPGSLASATAQQLAGEHGIEILARHAVTRIDRAARTIAVNGRSLPYSRLVLAVGGRPSRLRLAGSAVDRVLSVNNLGDYQQLRRQLDGRPRVAILGAGLVGCEFANDLVAAGHAVDVIDIAPRPLPRFWPEPMAREFQARLAAAGVGWHLAQGVERIDATDDGLSLALDSGRVLHADTVLSAVGLSANTALAGAAGLPVSRGIVVDRHLETADEHVYAIGDCAEVEGLLLPFIMPIMHAARALARTLAGERTAVVYPAMPVMLKTPACPAVFFPPAVPGGGEWHIEREAEGMRAFYRAADGALLGAALSGSCTRERDAVLKQLPALMGPA
jgi:rubredoxin---NAD+ reductase